MKVYLFTVMPGLDPHIRAFRPAMTNGIQRARALFGFPVSWEDNGLSSDSQDRGKLYAFNHVRPLPSHRLHGRAGSACIGGFRAGAGAIELPGPAAGGGAARQAGKRHQDEGEWAKSCDENDVRILRRMIRIQTQLVPLSRRYAQCDRSHEAKFTRTFAKNLAEYRERLAGCE